METSKSINNDIENRMLATERRLVHMASLLSESEAENARLTQLANVLKEEIRSYQRSEERIKHIENLEYVKNVILKVLYNSSVFYLVPKNFRSESQLRMTRPQIYFIFYIFYSVSFTVFGLTEIRREIPPYTSALHNFKAVPF